MCKKYYVQDGGHLFIKNVTIESRDCNILKTYNIDVTFTTMSNFKNWKIHILPAIFPTTSIASFGEGSLSWSASPSSFIKGMSFASYIEGTASNGPWDFFFFTVFSSPSSFVSTLWCHCLLHWRSTFHAFWLPRTLTWNPLLTHCTSSEFSLLFSSCIGFALWLPWCRPWHKYFLLFIHVLSIINTNCEIK